MHYTLPHVSLQVPEEYLKPYLGEFGETPYYGSQGYASTRYPYSTYAGMISFLDAQVGIVLARLKELGLDENTLVMFSSDNGTTLNGGVNAALLDRKSTRLNSSHKCAFSMLSSDLKYKSIKQ